jgi:hypothetical protein
VLVLTESLRLRLRAAPTPAGLGRPSCWLAFLEHRSQPRFQRLGIRSARLDSLDSHILLCLRARVGALRLQVVCRRCRLFKIFAFGTPPATLCLQLSLKYRLLLNPEGIEAFRPPDQAGTTDSASLSCSDAAAVKHHVGGAALAKPQASSERQEHPRSTY